MQQPPGQSFTSQSPHENTRWGAQIVQRSSCTVPFQTLLRHAHLGKG